MVRVRAKVVEPGPETFPGAGVGAGAGVGGGGEGAGAALHAHPAALTHAKSTTSYVLREGTGE